MKRAYTKLTTRALVSFVVVWTGAGVAANAQWEAAPSFPLNEARSYGSAVVYQGRIYSVGGRPFVGLESSTTVFSLTDFNGLWRERYPLEGQIIGQGAGVDALGRFLVIGGEDVVGGDTGANRMYDPDQGFTGPTIPDRPNSAPAIGFAFCVDTEARLYSLGGGPGDEYGSLPTSDLATRYDALQDSWEILAPLPVPVAWASAVDDGAGHIMVLGGVTSDGTERSAEVQVYDKQSNTWSTTSVPDLPIPISDAGAALGADGRVYIIGGRTGPIGAGVTLDTVYALDPASNTWQAGPRMSVPRRNLAVVTVPAQDGGYILAMGGENEAGGTVACERLFTADCPSLLSTFAGSTFWAGPRVGLEVHAVGGGDLMYQWFRDGQEIHDGAKPTGGVYAGTDSPELILDPAFSGDSATYSCIISNACGSVIGEGFVNIQEPPQIPTDLGAWELFRAFPGGSIESEVTAISGLTAVGWASYMVDWNGSPLEVSRPFVWHGPGWWNEDLTPSGSVGGAILDIDGDLAPGWYWRVYQCGNFNCGFQAAGFWNITTRQFTDRHPSGAEYSSLMDIDQDTMVGWGTHDQVGGQGHYTCGTVAHAPNYYPVEHCDKTFSAVGDGYVFGKDANGRLMRWDRDILNGVDLTPPGVQGTMTINGAGDGQAVGGVNWNGQLIGGIWTGSGNTFSELTPAGAATSSLHNCASGVQAGSIRWSDDPTHEHAAIWTGTPESVIDLHDLFDPIQYDASVANDVEVLGDGSVVVVGKAFNGNLGKWLAMMWIAPPVPSCPADLTGDGVADSSDFFAYLDLFAAGDPAADITGNGTIDADDFFAYLDLFADGC